MKVKRILLSCSGFLLLLGLLFTILSFFLPTFKLCRGSNTEEISVFIDFLEVYLSSGSYSSIISFSLFFVLCQAGAIICICYSMALQLVNMDEKKSVFSTFVALASLASLTFFVSRIKDYLYDNASTKIYNGVGFVFLITALVFVIAALIISAVAMIFNETEESIEKGENEDGFNDVFNELESYYDLLQKKIIKNIEYEIKCKGIIKKVTKSKYNKTDMKKLIKWKEEQEKGLITEEEFLEIKESFDL